MQQGRPRCLSPMDEFSLALVHLYLGLIRTGYCFSFWILQSIMPQIFTTHGLTSCTRNSIKSHFGLVESWFKSSIYGITDHSCSGVLQLENFGHVGQDYSAIISTRASTTYILSYKTIIPTKALMESLPLIYTGTFCFQTSQIKSSQFRVVLWIY